MEGLPSLEELQRQLHEKESYQKDDELAIWLPERFVADENQYEDDMLYLKRMYPDIGKEIAEFVEDKCDEMEYEGSLMFDQYPDKISFMRLVDDIYENIKYHDEQSKYLKYLVQIMLCDEMHHRRSRHHRKRRYFF